MDSQHDSEEAHAPFVQPNIFRWNFEDPKQAYRDAFLFPSDKLAERREESDKVWLDGKSKIFYKEVSNGPPRSPDIIDPRLFPADQIQLGPIVPFRHFGLHTDMIAHRIEFGEVSLWLPPDLNDQTLQLLSDMLFSSFEALIIQEQIGNKYERSIQVLCVEAEKILQAFCLFSQWLSDCLDSLPELSIGLCEKIIFFCEAYSFSSRVVLRGPFSIELAVACRVYFVVMLQHLSKLKSITSELAEPLGMLRKRLMTDIFQIFEYLPHLVRLDLPAQLPESPETATKLVVAMLLRQFAALLVGEDSSWFQELQAHFLTDQSEKSPRYCNVLWSILFSSVEALQFDSLTGHVLASPDMSDAWTVVTKLMVHEDSQAYQLWPKMNRCLQLSLVLPAPVGSPLKDIWSALFGQPPSFEPQSSFPRWLPYDIFRAGGGVPIPSVQAVVAHRKERDAPLDLFLKMVFVAVTKLDKAKVGFSVNSLLTETFSAAQKYANPPISPMNSAQARLCLVTALSVTHIVLLLCGAHAINVWNNVSRTLWPDQDSKNMATLMKQLGRSPFEALFTGMFKMLLLGVSIPNDKLLGVTKQLRSACDRLVQTIRQSTEEAILVQKLSVKEAKLRTPENFHLFEYLRGVQELYDVDNRKPESKSVVIPPLLELVSPGSMAAILQDPQKYFDISQRVVLLQGVEAWLLYLIEHKMELSMDLIQKLLDAYNPLKDLLFSRRMSSEGNLVPIAAKCLAAFVRLFYHNGKLVANNVPSLGDVFRQFSIHTDTDARWYTSDWQHRVLHQVFIKRVMALSVPLNDPFTWMPVAIWLHSMLENKVNVQVEVLKKVLDYEPAKKLALFSWASRAELKNRIALEKKQKLELLEKRKGSLIIPREQDVRNRYVENLNWIVAFLRAVRQSTLKMTPEALTAFRNNFMVVFKDLAALSAKIADGELPADDWQRIAYHRYSWKVLCCCFALCPNLLWDFVGVRWPLASVLTYLEKADWSNSASDSSRLPVQYVLHGYAQIRFYNHKHYAGRFIQLIQEYLSATKKIVTFASTKWQLPGIDKLVLGITPPSMTDKFSIYRDATSAAESPMQPSSADATQASTQPAVASQPETNGIKPEKTEPKAEMPASQVPPVQPSRRPTQLEAIITQAVGPMRDMFLIALLPEMLIKTRASPTTGQATQAIVGQIFRVLLTHSAKDHRFGKDFVAFVRNIDVALEYLSASGADMDIRCNMYAVLAEAIRHADASARASLVRGGDAKWTALVDKSFELLSLRLCFDMFLCSSTIFPFEHRQRLEATRNEHRVLLSESATCLTPIMNEVFRETEWFSNINFIVPTVKVGREKALVKKLIDHIFFTILPFMRGINPTKCEFIINVLMQLTTTAPQTQNPDKLELKQDVLVALRTFIELPLAARPT